MIDIEQAARVAHEVNRAYCVACGDFSQPPWDEAPEWQRKSAEAGVRFVMENPDANPGATHENWSRDKRADGWKFGLVKDPGKKEHPCLVPFAQLPLEQRIKDHLFMAVVRALAHKG